MPAPLQFSSFDDAAIRRIYETTDIAEQRQRKRRFIEKSQWTGKQIYFRAVAIGAIKPKKKEPQWTEEEDEFILKRAGLEIQKTRKLLIRNGFYARSLSAIGDRIRFLSGSVKVSRQDAGTYTANEVAEYLGVDSKTASRWCRSGLLKAKQGTQYGPHPVWWIQEADIRRFILENTALVNFARADKFFIVDVLVPHHGAKSKEAA